MDRPFQYRVPAEFAGRIEVGVCVRVPFGKGGGTRKGYVVGLSDIPEIEESRIKDILGPEGGVPGAHSRLIALASRIRSVYACTMAQALKTVLPVKKQIRTPERKTLCCLLPDGELKKFLAEEERKSHRARARVLRAFLNNREIPLSLARDKLSVSADTVKTLERDGALRIRTEKKTKDMTGYAGRTENRVTLNAAQQAAVDAVLTGMEEDSPKKWLLYGVTGSGKTEVYMAVIEKVLSAGKRVILLIPEIALTYQTVMRFYERFGDAVAIMNSRLSDGERYEEWRRAESGEAKVMIGPRSALFAPFPNLGLIIIDEEQENAYQSELMPRYHARTAAGMLADLWGCPLILGSATPSMEAFYAAEQGEYSLLCLPARAVPESSLAETITVDMRKELAEGNKSMISRELRTRIQDTLKNGKQAMLFINRRGYSNFVSCRSCGEPLRCPHCDVSLTLHGKSTLICHYCGYTVPLMKQCPCCSSPYLAGFGAGTQKLEELVLREFPGARVLRMDADTTSRKGSHEEILQSFASREADILIGTQMIVKGHDFPDVTLVGILAADLSLNTPDFRAAERTFDLLTQAAGRAGRRKDPGVVVIQTYEPDHYAVETAAAQDYRTFYRREMAFRRLMKYPPSGNLYQILLADKDEEELNFCADRIRNVLDHHFADGKNAGVQAAEEVIGPVPAPVYRVKDVYRKNLYIKTQKYDILDKIRSWTETEALGGRRPSGLLVTYCIC